MIAARVPPRMVLVFLCGFVGALTFAWIISITTGSDAGKLSGGDDVIPVGIEMSTFAIGGDLEAPLQPGLTSALDLKISNPFKQTLGIHDLTVMITSVDAPNRTAELPCSVKDFATQAATGQIVLEGGATAALSALGLVVSEMPQVAMLNTNNNQDGCKGATLSLTYSGSGVTQ